MALVARSDSRVVYAATLDRLVAWSLEPQRGRRRGAHVWVAKSVSHCHGYCSLAVGQTDDLLYAGFATGAVMEYCNMGSLLEGDAKDATKQRTHEAVGLRRLLPPSGQNGGAMCVAQSPGGASVAVGGGKGRLWLFKDRQTVHHWTSAHEDLQVRCLAWLGPHTLASGDGRGRIIVHEERGGVLVLSKTIDAHAGVAVNALVASTALGCLYSGGDDRKVRAWYGSDLFGWTKDATQRGGRNEGGERDACARSFDTVECCEAAAPVAALALAHGEGTLYVGDAAERFFGFHAEMIPALRELLLAKVSAMPQSPKAQADAPTVGPPADEMTPKGRRTSDRSHFTPINPVLLRAPASASTAARAREVEDGYARAMFAREGPADEGQAAVACGGNGAPTVGPPAVEVEAEEVEDDLGPVAPADETPDDEGRAAIGGNGDDGEASANGQAASGETATTGAIALPMTAVLSKGRASPLKPLPTPPPTSKLAELKVSTPLPAIKTSSGAPGEVDLRVLAHGADVKARGGASR